jgi:hypothetical protein
MDQGDKWESYRPWIGTFGQQETARQDLSRDAAQDLPNHRNPEESLTKRKSQGGSQGRSEDSNWKKPRPAEVVARLRAVVRAEFRD